MFLEIPVPGLDELLVHALLLNMEISESFLTINGLFLRVLFWESKILPLGLDL